MKGGRNKEPTKEDRLHPNHSYVQAFLLSPRSPIAGTSADLARADVLDNAIEIPHTPMTATPKQTTAALLPPAVRPRAPLPLLSYLKCSRRGKSRLPGRSSRLYTSCTSAVYLVGPLVYPTRRRT